MASDVARVASRARAGKAGARTGEAAAAESPGADTARGAAEVTIVVASSGHSAISPDRRGEVLGLLGGPSCRCYVVRWSDGSTSVVPVAAATVVSARARSAGARLAG